MAAISTITINDGQGTPVAHNFNPQGIEGGIATWVDRVSGIALGYPKITFSLEEAGVNKPNNKVKLRVVRPVLEVTAPSTATGIQPAPTLAYNLVFDCTFVLPMRSSSAERADILAYAKNILANALVTNAVNNYEQAW